MKETDGNFINTLPENIICGETHITVNGRERTVVDLEDGPILDDECLPIGAYIVLSVE